MDGLSRYLGGEAGILDSLGWGIMVVGRWSRLIRGYNLRMGEITGIPGDAALGRGVAEVFGHIEGLDFEALDLEIQQTGGFESRSLRLVRPGGDVVYRHLRGDVLRGSDGEEEGVVVSLQDVTEREFLRQSMSQYLAPEVMKLVLLSRPGEPIQGRELDVAVLVADMRDFTGTAEGLTPEELFRTLNAYLGPMVELVVNQGGLIDKFTGDGFMAVFGAPSSRGNDAEIAVRTALGLRAEVDRLFGERAEQGVPQLEIGYAVHWGPALAGSLGSQVRMEYTVVGDTVNVAHRVQALAGPGEVLVTGPAARAAGHGFCFGEGRWVRIRGRKAPVKVQPALGFAAVTP